MYSWNIDIFYFIIIFLISWIISCSGGCPVEYQIRYQGSCYYKIFEAKSRSESANRCSSSGGWLVTISSSDENSFINSKFGNSPAWIGLTKHVGSGIWEWDHPEETSYTNWTIGQPVPRNSLAAIMPSGGWNAIFQDPKYSGICEFIDETESPSKLPTRIPTKLPSKFPSRDPSSPPTNFPTPLPSSTPSSVTVKPSGHPSTFPSFSPTKQSSAPDITILGEISTSKTGAKIPIALTDSGSVYCSAYLTSTPKPIVPSTVSNVISSQQMIKISSPPYQGTVMISSLYPSSTYTLYCAAVSSSGSSVTDYTTMLKSSVIFRTQCCKLVTVNLQSKRYVENRVASDAMNLFVDAPPSAELKILLMLRNSNTLERLPDSILYPNFITISPGTTSWSTNIPISLNPMSTGQYLISLQVSGEDYLTNIPTSIFDIESSSIEPQSPRLTVAAFTSLGDGITVEFDSLTDRGSYSGYVPSAQFPCSSLFIFPGVETSICEWIDDTRVVATFQVSLEHSLPTIGENVTLLPNRIRSKCTAFNSTECRRWSTSTGQSVILASPSTPILPVVIVTLPSTIGPCTSPIFDLTSSIGSGGRDWTFNIIADVHGLDGNVTEDIIYSQALNQYFTEVFVLSPPSRIPSLLLRAGVVRFQVELCNFLNSCAIGTTQLSIQSEPHPVVTVLGQKYRTQVSSQALFIQAKAENYICSNNSLVKTSDHLKYTWNILDLGSNSYLNFTSVSPDPSKLRLQSYSLMVGNTYQITITVTNQISFLSGSSSLQIVVDSGAIISILRGATVKTIMLNKELIIDGSLSYDQNKIQNIDLIYKWSCYQSYPVIINACSLQMTPWKSYLTVSASNHSLIGTSQIVKFHLAESNSTRVSEVVEVELRVVSSTIPQLQISHFNKQFSSLQINSHEKLFISGLAEVYVGEVPGWWSIDDPSVNMSSCSLSPLSLALTTGVNSFNLILGPDCLPGRSTPYILSLNAGVAEASIEVMVNSPPSGGNFRVTPAIGYESETIFLCAASNFVDKDLPLSYEFGYLTPLHYPLIIQSRSELTSLSTVLPRGQDIDNWHLPVSVSVFDALDANRVLSLDVQVLKNLTVTYFSIPTGETNIDIAHSRIDMNSAIFNSVECTRAPSCINFNRKNCSTVTNTCGGCLDGFAGVAGNHNSPCIMTHEMNPQFCESSTDCASWFRCINGTCEHVLQMCPQNCTGNGECIFVDLNIGTTLPNCSLGDPRCQAECRCFEGYFGPACDILGSKVDEFETFLLLNETFEWVQRDDPTLDRLTSWIYTLRTLSASQQTLSPQTTYLLLNTTLLVLNKSSDIKLYFAQIQILYEVVNCIVSILYRQNDLMIEEILIALDKISSALVRDMDIDQSDMISIYDNMRVTNAVSKPKNANLPLLIKIPQTSLELYHQLSASSCEVRSNESFSSSTKFSLGSFPAKLAYSTNHQLISNSYRLLSYNTSGSVVNPTNHNITFVIQHNQILSNVSFGNETYVTYCNTGIRNTTQYVCNYSNYSSIYTIIHHCNGTRSYSLSTQCPRLSIRPSCVQLYSKLHYSCEVVQYTDWNTTCACFSLVKSLNRKLLSDNGTDSDESVVPLDVAVTVHYELTEFSDTWQDTQYNSIDDLEETFLIIIMYGILWATGGIGILWCLVQHRRKRNLFSLDAAVRASGVKTIKKMSSIDSENFTKRYVNSIVPMVFHERSTWDRLYYELVNQHRFLIPFFETSENNRILTTLNILTIQSMLMFILAVLYDTEYPNQQEACDAHSTEESCMNERAGRENICQWVYHTNHQQYSCDYIQPDASIETMIIFSIAISMLTAPINLVVDFLFLDILAAPTVEHFQKIETDESRVKIRVGMDRDHIKLMDSKSTEDTDSCKFLRWNYQKIRNLPPHTRNAQFLTSLASQPIFEEFSKKISKPNSSSTTESDIEELPQHTLAKASHDPNSHCFIAQKLTKQISQSQVVLSYEVEDPNNVDAVYQKFIRDLLIQRSKLSGRQLTTFDSSWCLDENCNFVSNFTHELKCGFLNSKAPNEIMKTEIDKTFQKCALYSKKFQSYEHHSIGLEMLQLFVIDLLGRDTSCAKIFANKAENDYRRTMIVPKYFKYFAWIIVFLLNILFIYFSLLRGLERGYKWQKIYVFACLIQILIEIFLYETTECIIMQFLIPNTAQKEVLSVLKLLTTLINHLCRNIDWCDPHQIILNSSEYFFISTNLCKLYPQLFESVIIRSFRSYLPGPIGLKWNSHFSSSTGDAIWISLMISFQKFQQFLASLNPLFLRMMVHALQPLVVAFIVILWVMLLNHPFYFLTLLGALLVIIFFHITIQRFNRKTEANSLSCSLEMITRENFDSLQPSSPEETVDWATTNPLNQFSESTGSQFIEEVEYDEEHCHGIELMPPSR